MAACPFWDPKHYPYVLQADFYSAQHIITPFELDLSSLECDVLTIRQCPDLTHYMFRDGRKSLQICCRNEGQASSEKLTNHLKLVFQMGDMTDYREQDLARKRLRYLAEMGCLPDHLFKVNKSSRRFQQILDVIDMQNRDSFHRDIAESLYDKDRITEDWNDPGRHLKSNVSYALKRARELMNGGYLEYLKKLDT